MLFRETVAVYCENHTEHRNTDCEGTMQSTRNIKADGKSCTIKDNVFVGSYTMVTSDRI
jgi:hypothetical protein